MEIRYVDRRASRESETVMVKAVVGPRLMGQMMQEAMDVR